jgi:carbon storage regulator CsrA
MREGFLTFYPEPEMGLILSRKRGERIFIGDGVVITVAEVAYGRVRLEIECDRNVKIVREETTSPATREEFERKIFFWKKDSYALRAADAGRSEESVP